jgi:ligand-binding sensor domain-containing protein
LAKINGGRITLYPTHQGVPVKEFLFEARDGSMWFSDIHNIYRFDGKSTFSIKISDPTYLFRISVKEDRDGSVWLVTETSLIRYYEGRAATYANYSNRQGNMPDDQALKLIEDRDGNIYLLARNGLFRLENGKFVGYGRMDELARLIDSKHPMMTALIDKEGNVWVGTYRDGLYEFKRAQITVYSEENGLSGDNFLAIMEDREGGVWLGGRHLFRFNAGTFTAFPSLIGRRALYQDREGGIWYGGEKGVRRFKDGRISEYPIEIADLWVTAIYEDKHGTLWLGSPNGPSNNGGLFRLKDGIFKKEERLKVDDVRRITEDSRGALWVGGTNGLSSIKDEVFTHYTTSDGLSNNYVRAIHEDTDGTLWIGTYGGGLNRFRNGKFVQITTQDGLFDNLVSQILEDERGNLWMSCNRGIYRVSRKELNDFADGKIKSINCISYSIADGMKTNECNGGGQPAGYKTRDGRLWFPTIKGVVVIDPKPINQLPPPVVVEKVVVNKVPVDLKQHFNLLQGNGDLEIHYTSLSFVSPQKIRFKYKLEGYDNDWIEVKERRVAYYTNLPPGQYIFRVIACNNDGVWNEVGASISLYLKPHFYQTY